MTHIGHDANDEQNEAECRNDKPRPSLSVGTPEVTK
jgi:hypothetical protein